MIRTTGKRHQLDSLLSVLCAVPVVSSKGGCNSVDESVFQKYLECACVCES